MSSEKESDEAVVDDAETVLENRLIQAVDLIKKQDWENGRAVLHDLIVSLNQGHDAVAAGNTTELHNNVIQTALLGQQFCLLALKRYDELVKSSHKQLSLNNNTELSHTQSLARYFLIVGLVEQRSFKDVAVEISNWLKADNDQQPTELLKELQTKVTKDSNASPFDEHLKSLRNWLDKQPTDGCSKNLPKLSSVVPAPSSRKNSDVDSNVSNNNKNGANDTNSKVINSPASKTGSSDDGVVSCSYCSLHFNDRSELRTHCQTDEHQKILMSDEGRDWKWRPPPRGHSAESYSLCENFAENQICHYGNQCADAHGVEELNEWKDRLEYRKTRLQRAREKELYGKSYIEQLLEKWVSASNPDKIMREKIEGVEDSCNSELVTTVSSKTSKREWVFMLRTKKPLRAVALLEDAHRNHFVIKQILASTPQVKKGREVELKSEQEWVSPTELKNIDDYTVSLEHRVKVIFSTDIYGTFRQSIVFDFGTEPVLVKHICVDVIPVTDADKIQEIKEKLVYSAAERWDEDNTDIIHFSQVSPPHLQTPAYLADIQREKELMERYPCPRASTFVLTQSTITEKKLTKNNYRSRMHELLYVEEIARYEQIARYNLTTTLKITTSYLLTPSGMATSTAKYSHSGELFALLSLSKDVSEDTSAGRLILNNCTSVFLSSKEQLPAGEKRKVYEAVIEDKGKNMIYLKLSAATVTGLGLTAETTEYTCDIQFQPSRLSYSEWHQAIDKIADFKIIFPDTGMEPKIPWTPQRQWDSSLDARLNAKQREAIMAITTGINHPLPPILLIGPFGTGKTYTLAQAIKQLLHQPEARILICTHSNSAADLYIKDYLHPWVEEGMEEARPLRVYYHKRWVATVHNVVQKYCLIDLNGNVRNFRRPSAEDILKYRIVVVTLNISMELASLDLPKGYFTHILLDEAAQAMECEAIMPLALASENTRIVLAGDHMQMSPEIFSNFAKERKLHVSLLERLYDHYPTDFPCKILLCENYRAHEAIVKFTSELFYEQKLLASGKIPKHDRFYPLTFFTTRGEDVQDKNSTTFYNNAEVYEVVERVSELRKKWPSSWGKINDQSIGIMTPYADQVFRIRSELRKRRMAGISVERVLNVQGKQFRAIFLSTVRTRRTCSNAPNGKEEDVDFGFLSNSKLLNTAITRAQSLVAVVGDPVALCSIGKCRKIWERFIEICHQNKSLFGITWNLLRSQLDGVELKKTYVLNPNAPEFIPRALQHEAYLREQTQYHHHGGYHHHSNHHSHYGPAHGYRQPPHMHIPRLDSHGPLSSAQFQNGQHHGMHGPHPQGQQFPYQNPLYYQNQQMLRGPPPIPGPFQQNNPWGQFPVVPAGRNTPPGWRPPKYPHHNQIRPPAMQPPHLPNRAPLPPQQPPLRSPSSQHLQMPYAMPKQPPPPPQAQPQPPQLQQQPPFSHVNSMRGANNAPQISPAQFPQLPPTFNTDHHHIGAPLPQEVLTSIAASRSQQQQQQQQAVLPQQPQSLLSQATSQDSMVRANERDYQFLQHVHFPEKAQLMNAASVMQQKSQQQQQPQPNFVAQQLAQQQPQQPQQQVHPIPAQPNDLTYLLPPGMSFYDMAIESKDNQIKWFVRLMETHGIEAANKFSEILRQVPASAALNASTPTSASTNKVLAPGTDQFDIFLDDLMKSPTAVQPLLKDIWGFSSAASSSSGVSSGGHQMSNGFMGSQSSKSSIDSADLFGVAKTESIPLYRRAATQSYSNSSMASSKNQSIASSTPDLLDQSNLFDSIEKLSQNFSSSLFTSNFNEQNGFPGGGLPSIQTLAANLNVDQPLANFTQSPQSMAAQLQTVSQQYQNQQNMMRGPPQMPNQLQNTSQLSNQMSLMQNMNQELQNLSHMQTSSPMQLSRLHTSYAQAQAQSQHPHQQQRLETAEEMINRQNAATSATYASVLLSGASNSSAQNKTPGAAGGSKDDPKDPFVSHLCPSLGKSNGYYNYFQ